jgi:hypothetical protein
MPRELRDQFVEPRSRDLFAFLSARADKAEEAKPAHSESSQSA